MISDDVVVAVMMAIMSKDHPIPDVDQQKADLFRSRRALEAWKMLQAAKKVVVDNSEL